MTSTLTARRLITDIGVIEFPVLAVADGLITDISSDPRALAHETDTLTAAFLDIHTHGALNHDVMTATPADLSQMQGFLAQHGVAHYLPTTVTASIDTTLRALDSLANAIETATPANEAKPIGIHLEGPFLSHAKRGVHPTDLLQLPSIELFDRFQTASRGHIKLVTIAPEANAVPARGNSSALELISHAANTGVRVSLGHSNATTVETLAAIAAGASSATHTFNAMRPLDHREPGILGTVLDDDHLFAELICDGVHVAPALVQLWLRAKGEAHAILVTDAMSAAGMPDGEYLLGSLAVTVANGAAHLTEDLQRGKQTLAGSVLTMDRAVANLQMFTHAPLAQATSLASHNPAAMLGLSALTRLAPDSPANLNRFSTEDKLIATYLNGRQIN